MNHTYKKLLSWQIFFFLNSKFLGNVIDVKTQCTLNHVVVKACSRFGEVITCMQGNETAVFNKNNISEVSFKV